MKDKKLAETICYVWNDIHTGTFEQTDTIAEIEKWCGGYQVKNVPALYNEGNSFHYIKELAAITAAFNVTSHLYVNEMNEIIAYIY